MNNAFANPRGMRLDALKYVFRIYAKGWQGGIEILVD
jgi:hypothetical protein